MDWQINRADQKMRIVLMVSKFGHCLNDLLFRARIGALPVEIAAVVSNHTDFAELVGSYDIPFHHIPVTKDTKADAEARLMELVREENVELVVLARYMQVLSDDLCKQLSGRIINIHHSFLPSFKGAKPYHQAHARGVKLIGATAHYVTADLDEGPIIEQEVERVGHDVTPDQLVAVGRDVECQALARAVKWHAERPADGRLRLGPVRRIMPQTRGLVRTSAALSSVVDAPRLRPLPPCSCTGPPERRKGGVTPACAGVRRPGAERGAGEGVTWPAWSRRSTSGRC
jgi:formyltetrahydrofolate deformylase